MFYYNRFYLQEERGMYRYDDRIISWPFDSTILVRRFAFDFCDPICQCMPCVRHLRSWDTHFLISWAIWWSHSSFDCNFGCNHTGPFLELDEVQEHLFESVIKTKHGFPADLGMSAGCGGNLQVEVVPLCELLSEEWLLKPLKRRFLLRARTRRTIHIYIYMGFYGI